MSDKKNEIMEKVSTILSGNLDIDTAIDNAKTKRVLLHEVDNYDKLEGLMDYGWILQHVENRVIAINKTNDNRATVGYSNSKNKYYLTIPHIVYGLTFDSIEDIVLFYTKLNTKLFTHARDISPEKLVDRINDELL